MYSNWLVPWIFPKKCNISFGPYTSTSTDSIADTVQSESYEVSQIGTDRELMQSYHISHPQNQIGWSSCAIVLGKLPVQERPFNLGSSRTRAYCTCSRCRWGFGHFSLVYPISLFSPSLWETTLYRLKYFSKGR